MGHLLAIRDGLKLAIHYNLPVTIAKVSSAAATSLLCSSGPNRGDSHFIVNDIRALLSIVGFCKCQASPREGNSLTLNLASCALSSSKELLWLNSSLCP